MLVVIEQELVIPGSASTAYPITAGAGAGGSGGASPGTRTELHLLLVRITSAGGGGGGSRLLAPRRQLVSGGSGQPGGSSDSWIRCNNGTGNTPTITSGIW